MTKMGEGTRNDKLVFQKSGLESGTRWVLDKRLDAGIFCETKCFEIKNPAYRKVLVPIYHFGL
jgi:hypothetical protein